MGRRPMRVGVPVASPGTAGSKHGATNGFKRSSNAPGAVRAGPRRFRLVGAVGVLGTLLVPAGPAQGGLLVLLGLGETATGFRFWVDAGASATGPVTGHALYCVGINDPQQTCGDGRVVQLLPPSDGRYWCVTSQISNHDRKPPDPNEVDYHALLLYRPGEDGAPDEVDVKLGPGTTPHCEALPSPAEFRPLRAGEVETFRL